MNPKSLVPRKLMFQIIRWGYLLPTTIHSFQFWYFGAGHWNVIGANEIAGGHFLTCAYRYGHVHQHLTVHHGLRCKQYTHGMPWAHKVLECSADFDRALLGHIFTVHMDV